jgi:DNA-binding CsgD family transcriptional regulator
LTSKLYPAAADPECSQSAVDTLAAWGQSKASRDLECDQAKHHPRHDGTSRARGRSCRKIHTSCDFPVTGSKQCPECAILDDSHLKPDQIDRIFELLLQHHAIRGVVEQAVHQICSSHVSAILLTKDALIIGCDARGQSSLKSGHVLKVAKGYLHCSDPVSQSRFLAVLEKTARTGRAANLLVYPIGYPEHRFSMTLAKIQDRETTIQDGDNPTCFSVLCVLSRLDQRRFATVRQLMELFALSAAEARLTHALCQGNSLGEYASDQGLKQPTVRTQLRSVLAKTGTRCQATLIPSCCRDSCYS